MTKQELHQSYVNYVNLVHEMSKKDERFKFEDIMSLQDYADFGQVFDESPEEILQAISDIAKEQGEDLSELILAVKPEFDKLVSEQ